ncbi:MAG: hypothetical protein CMM85_16535 [Rhodothermaceae bacterium]|nr:hypothetical protein [Rhodothermaceae bacterium]
MRALLDGPFADVTPEAFGADLDEKDAAVLLYDPTGRLAGFSTLLRIETTHGGRPVTAFFSGDTVVRTDARGAALLPRLWSQHVFAEAARQPERDTVWFLLSSGFRTYRFLPTFFARFTPSHDDRSPASDRALLAALARARYADRYDADAGVVRLAHPTPLRDDPTLSRRLSDPHVAFFAHSNPGWTQGDELACLTRIHPDNLTEAGRRMVYG